MDEGWAAYGSGDYATALREWRPLAEQGVSEAQYNLGIMYRDGDGEPQNYVQAYIWFNLAATQGNNLALKKRDINAEITHRWASANRDWLAERMTPADISEAQRLAREWWAKHGKK